MSAPPGFWQDTLYDIVDWPRAYFVDGIRTLINGWRHRLIGWRDWFESEKAGSDDWLWWLLGWWIEFFGWWSLWTYVSKRSHDMFDIPLGFLYALVGRGPWEFGWLGGGFDYDTYEWWWVLNIDARITNARYWLSQAGAVLDTWGGDLYTTVTGWFYSLLDPLGVGLGWIAEKLGHPQGNPWWWIRDNSFTFWDALKEVAIQVGYAISDALGATYSNAIDWVTAQAYATLSWVEEEKTNVVNWANKTFGVPITAINDWIAEWQPFLDWLYQIKVTLQELVDDPAQFIWSRLLPGLWDRVEPWLLSVWEGTDERPPQAPRR